MPATDDEIREKYLERAIRELNLLTRDIQSCEHCPRGALMPVLGSGPPPGRHHAAQVRADALGDRGGRRLLRALRQRADEVAAAAADRPARRLRHALRQVPGAPTPRSPTRPCMARVAEEIAIVSPKIIVVDGRGRALRARRARCSRSPARCSRGSARSSSSRRRSPRCTSEHRPGARRRARQARVLGRRSACSATGTPSCRPTERRARSCRACRRRRSARRRRRPRASGKVAAIGTVSAPRSNSRQHAALHAPRGQRLLLQRTRAQRRAADARALAHQRAQVDLGAWRRRRAPMTTIRPPSASAWRFSGEVRRADELEDHVERPVLGEPLRRDHGGAERRRPRRAARDCAPSRGRGRRPPRRAGSPPCRRRPLRRARAAARRRRGAHWLKIASCAVVKTSGAPPGRRPVKARQARASGCARGPTASSAWPPPPTIPITRSPSEKRVAPGPERGDLARQLESRDVRRRSPGGAG